MLVINDLFVIGYVLYPFPDYFVSPRATFFSNRDNLLILVYEVK